MSILHRITLDIIWQTTSSRKNVINIINEELRKCTRGISHAAGRVIAK